MAIAPTHTFASDILKALGLDGRKVISLNLRMAVNDLVRIDTEEFADTDRVAGFAREIVERNYRVARWIPVDESLPPDNHAVLVWHNASGAEMAYREDGAWRMSWVHYQVGPCEYTHWMPLPGGPE